MKIKGTFRLLLVDGSEVSAPDYQPVTAELEVDPDGNVLAMPPIVFTVACKQGWGMIGGYRLEAEDGEATEQMWRVPIWATTGSPISIEQGAEYSGWAS